MKKVELGGGPHPIHSDWEQLDALDWSKETGLSYVIGKAEALPYKDGRVSQLYAANLLEHFPDPIPILKEWARVLEPGGILEVVVPDSMGILMDYFNGIDEWEHTTKRLLGDRDYEGNFHYYPFTFYEFPDIVDEVPELKLVQLTTSHNGGGVYAIMERLDVPWKSYRKAE